MIVLKKLQRTGSLSTAPVIVINHSLVATHSKKQGNCGLTALQSAKYAVIGRERREMKEGEYKGTPGACGH